MSAPMPEIERPFMRRLLLVLTTPITIILGVLGGAILFTIELVEEMYHDCW